MVQIRIKKALMIYKKYFEDKLEKEKDYSNSLKDKNLELYKEYNDSKLKTHDETDKDKKIKDLEDKLLSNHIAKTRIPLL